ncbi:RagB/SusD family nutrient uptake outer membrane protein [uncultured Polaribacter sp.]|uniref:RagB/SusD family nutrient uptake outer membrane protein n=1 Tax=uncultured Polaribacter sp. TaxID=174711 RepID=UPI0026017847|nr:RagB/SusD family nutrient uptake outer membrane protein [uncultured Polaribacter sp.]
MKLINKILIVIILMLCMVSCSSFLEDDIQYTEEAVVTTSGIRSRGLIEDIYTDYSFRYFTDFSGEYLSDNGVLNSSETNLANNNWGVAEGHPYNYIWQQSYNNLRQIYQYIELIHNSGLPYLPSPEPLSVELSDRIVARYYGEAFFLKAWAEWELLKTYGGQAEDGTMLGFPIVNGILENEEYAKLTRNTFQECVDQIMQDLDVAIAGLPLNYNNSVVQDDPATPDVNEASLGFDNLEVGRASGLAAYALKAKVALFAASPAFNPTNDVTKWELAAKYAQDVIDMNGGLRTLSSFNVGNENNPNHIWRMRNSRNNNSLENRLYPPSLYGQGEVNPSQNLIDAFPAANGYPISDSQSLYNDSNPYQSRDVRFYRFIFYNGDQGFGSENATDFNPLEIYTGGADNFGGFIANEGTRTGYYLKKFLNNLNFDPSAINPLTNQPKVYVQLGLTEIYLSYAEAVNEAYGIINTAPPGLNYSAKAVMARVRQRANYFFDPYLDEVSSDSNRFREFVKNERRIELCFKGERFHDLRRWKDLLTIEDIRGVKITKDESDVMTYENTIVERRGYSNKNLYLPIPYTETIINPNLKQNIGW